MTTVEDIEKHKRNTKWINNNYGRLAEDYDERYIAVWEQGVVKSGLTVNSVKNKVKRDDNLPRPDKMVIEYIEKNPTNFIG